MKKIIQQLLLIFFILKKKNNFQLIFQNITELANKEKQIILLMIPNEEKEDGYFLAVKEMIFIIT